LLIIKKIKNMLKIISDSFYFYWILLFWNLNHEASAQYDQRQSSASILPDNPCHLFFQYVQNQGTYEGRLKIKFTISDPKVVVTIFASIAANLPNVSMLDDFLRF
jgi:hypothetical protein